MGTKTTKTKTATSTKRAAKSKPVAEVPATTAPRPALPKAAAENPKPAVRRKKKPSYSQDDIALRAYFIAESRQAGKLPGDSHQDWIEAERQLAAEASTPRRPNASKR